MSAWLVVALLTALGTAGLALVPLTFRFSLRARGEPSGFWAVAGGVQLGPLAGSGVAAQGVVPRLALHAFGRKLWEKQLVAPRAGPSPQPPEARSVSPTVVERYRALERWLDPIDLFFFLARERRRIALLPTVVDLEYGFRDIATTGKLLGAIYALTPLLPGPLRVRQSPSWESVDRASLAASGAVRIWPGLLVVDAAWYLIRNVRVRRRTRAARGAPEAT